MRLISWNVNGLRAVMKKGFMDIFDEFNADVFALQETKLQAGQIEMDLPGYHQYWNYAEKKGYSGTAVFCKEEPIRVIDKIGIPELDTEGRILALEFEKYWFVNVYTPNAQSELKRLDHRMSWDVAFRDFCKALEQGITPEDAAQQTGPSSSPKPVVMTGDFNVAHQEIDLKNPRTNRGNPGFSDEEREKFTELLDEGFVDTFRYLHPNLEGAYSWWSYRFNARANNAGWRIDYFLVSQDLIEKVVMAHIYQEVFGSDHCPVSVELDI
ncbi:MAG: exodeoxyribonuclease III [Anaerotardibacter sp.]